MEPRGDLTNNNAANLDDLLDSRLERMEPRGDLTNNNAPNLDDLLDSALQEFDKVKQKPKKVSLQQEKNVEKELMDLFAAAGLGGAGAELRLNKPSSGGSATVQGGSSETTLQDALLKMSKDSESLAAMPTEEEMSKMFDGLKPEALEDGLSNLMPMMEGMMQSLLSKDLLYPAIKDMNQKFPDWLADNRKSLSEADYQKYNRQFQLTSNICQEFEAETAESGEAEKKERFERVMASMQEMQELGQPPQEVAGNQPPGFNQPDQCSIS